MTGWTKLFASIVTSSVWCEDDSTLRVWVAMMATADAKGVVEGSIPGFANLARVTPDQMVAAVKKLSAPDSFSRTPDHEGRRIEAIAGGWKLLNYDEYRKKAQAKDGSRAPYMRERRAKAKDSGNALHKDVTRYTEERREKQEAGTDNSNGLRADARLPRRKPVKAGVDRNDSTEARAVICLRYEILGGDPAVTGPKLKATARALTAGFTVDKLRQVFEAIRDAADDRSLAAFCARQNKAFEYSIRPEVAQKILDELTTPTRASIVQHPSSPRHTFTSRPQANRDAAEAFMRKKA